MDETVRVRVEPITLHQDARGLVFEPMGPDEFPAQRNCHLVVTLPGGIRGNHFHHRGTEVMVVLGPALVRYREGQQTIDHNIVPGQAVRFTFPPGIPHALLNNGEIPQISVAFNTQEHHQATPDVSREVMIENP